jgi:hypothetical protein
MKSSSTTIDNIPALARPGAFPELTTLDLHSSVKRKASADDVTRFLSAWELPRLQHLDLQGWPVNDAGAKALAGQPGARQPDLPGTWILPYRPGRGEGAVRVSELAAPD